MGTERTWDVTMKKKRHSCLVAVYLLLKKKDSLLLARRYNTGYADGYYSLPAGHLEKNETVSEALIREVQEEIGIKIDSEHLQMSHVLYRSKMLEDFEYIDFFFTVDEWQGKVKNMEPEKCDDLQWFTSSALPPNTLAYITHVIEQIDLGNTFSEYVEE